MCRASSSEVDCRLVSTANVGLVGSLDYFAIIEQRVANNRHDTSVH